MSLNSIKTSTGLPEKKETKLKKKEQNEREQAMKKKKMWTIMIRKNVFLPVSLGRTFLS